MLAIVWILFFLILLVILVSHTVVSIWQYFKKRDSYYLKRILLVWSIPLIFFGVLAFLAWVSSPVQVTKDTIVGCYEIDDSFYNGPNAQWQKKHFRFEVKDNDTFIFYERLADQTDKPFKGKLKWANGHPEKWSVTMQDRHHVVNKYPTLYRGQSGFYYVLRSAKFGNMFFRKIGNSCLVKLGL